MVMQYYAETLHRAFVIFICFDGLYGSKFRGVVSNFVHGFFRPMQGMLADPAKGFLVDTVRGLVGGFVSGGGNRSCRTQSQLKVGNRRNSALGQNRDQAQFWNDLRIRSARPR